MGSGGRADLALALTPLHHTGTSGVGQGGGGDPTKKRPLRPDEAENTAELGCLRKRVHTVSVGFAKRLYISLTLLNYLYTCWGQHVQLPLTVITATSVKKTYNITKITRKTLQLFKMQTTKTTIQMDSKCQPSLFGDIRDDTQSKPSDEHLHAVNRLLFIPVNGPGNIPCPHVCRDVGNR